jgi:YD repeat-containing protein
MEADEPPYQFEGVAHQTTYDEQDRPIETRLPQRGSLDACRATSLMECRRIAGPRDIILVMNLHLQSKSWRSRPGNSHPENVISYTYDEAGRCTERKYEMDGHERFRCRFAFDDRGNPIEMRVESSSLIRRMQSTHIPPLCVIPTLMTYRELDRARDVQSKHRGRGRYAAKIDRRAIEYFWLIIGFVFIQIHLKRSAFDNTEHD